MALRDILGQEKALGILKGGIVKACIAHAYLFTGEDGIGKKLTAINFAKTLNCAQNTEYRTQNTDKKNPGSGFRVPGSGIDCCDNCPSCIKINKGIHPDVFIIEPQNGQIRVDIIRKLEESLSYKPFEGKWKIAIIDEADNFNQSAANAFLKTLEEPPEQSLLILISSMPGLIPSTIRSRCQRINFSPLPLDKMAGFLEQKGLQNDEHLLSILSGGRPGWALSEDLISKRNTSFDEFKTLLGNIEGVDIWADKDSMEEWFEWAFLWLRDIAVFKATGKADLLINHDKETEIKDISKNARLKDILTLSGDLYKIKDFLRFNLNKQITLYHTSLLLKKALRLSSHHRG